MSIQTHYLQTAIALLQKYQPPQPFALYLKSFFAGNKKYGSRDRKAIAKFCYAFLRIGRGWQGEANEQTVAEALWLISRDSEPLLQNVLPHLAEIKDQSFAAKAKALSLPGALEWWFPFSNKMGALNRADKFLANLLEPQSVFIRIRPGQRQRVLDKLHQSSVAFEVITEDVCSFAPNTQIDQLLVTDKEAVIQDYASRQTGAVVRKFINNHLHTEAISVWDVCAASGGKSIMLADDCNVGQLICSDIRPAILANLKKRFATAGMRNYKAIVADLSTDTKNIVPHAMDVVLCDVPCSGSGTWARTPEQIFCYREEVIGYYAALQKKIWQNASRHVRENGLLIYMTCSVFADENEQQVAAMENEGWHCREQTYIEGALYRADTMYLAILQKA